MSYYYFPVCYIKEFIDIYIYYIANFNTNFRNDSVFKHSSNFLNLDIIIELYLRSCKVYS